MNAWNGWIDKAMRKIINSAVDHFSDHNIDIDQVVEILNCTFGVMFLIIRDKRMPSIRFTSGLATFSPSPAKILKKLKKIIARRPEAEEEITDLQKVYYRIKNEEDRRMFGKKLN